MALLRNANTGEIVATRVQPAASWVERAIGLLTRREVRPDEGLWIEPCSAIHTIGMRVPIDVIFLDKAKRIIRMHSKVPKWRWAIVCWKAHSVIELGSGALQQTDLLPGDCLELVH
jgi:uncharacterized membrane protein (UPF0127 family)